MPSPTQDKRPQAPTGSATDAELKELVAETLLLQRLKAHAAKRDSKTPPK